MRMDLDRLTALDAALASDKGLQIDDYVELTGISLRTAYRDLENFREAGQLFELYDHADGTARYHYIRGVTPLFSCNLKRRRR